MGRLAPEIPDPPVDEPQPQPQPNPDPQPVSPITPPVTPAPTPTRDPRVQNPATQSPTGNPTLEQTLPPMDVACSIGGTSEMTFRIPAGNVSYGGTKDAYCVGFVKFESDEFDGSYYDTSTTPWTRVSATANGRSYNPNPRNIPNHVHTSTVVYADGRREEQYCTFWAKCENGRARGVWFTW